jgi:hypothetical protein
VATNHVAVNAVAPSLPLANTIGMQNNQLMTAAITPMPYATPGCAKPLSNPLLPSFALKGSATSPAEVKMILAATTSLPHWMRTRLLFLELRSVL